MILVETNTGTEEYVEVQATLVDPHGNTETVYAGSHPAWAWSIDRCSTWRRTMRTLLLADRTFDPSGWRVRFDLVQADAVVSA